MLSSHQHLWCWQCLGTIASLWGCLVWYQEEEAAPAGPGPSLRHFLRIPGSAPLKVLTVPPLHVLVFAYHPLAQRLQLASQPCRMKPALSLAVSPSPFHVGARFTSGEVSHLPQLHVGVPKKIGKTFSPFSLVFGASRKRFGGSL